MNSPQAPVSARFPWVARTASPNGVGHLTTHKRLLSGWVVNYRRLIRVGMSYRLPPQGRGYVWAEEEWADLWSGIVRLRDSPTEQRHLGLVVIEESSDHEFLVVDGEQQLMTLGLFCVAVVNRLRRLARKGTDSEKSLERAQIIQDRFVGETDPSSFVERNRLVLNETDYAFYRDCIVRDRAPADLRTLPRSARLIRDGYSFFIQRLSEDDALRDDGAAVADLLYATVGSQLLFLLIEIDGDLNACPLFETSHAHATDLKVTDLFGSGASAEPETGSPSRSRSRETGSLP